MKQGLSRKLAKENIRKNYRFFVPRILAETGLLACFYIIFTLSRDDRLSKVKGGSYLPEFMWMGAVIIGLLSFILILYTNSFLMKQRKGEFGLYSVLGMEKKHICRILFHESAICSLTSIVAGLSCGILFYKLSSLAISKLLKAEIVAGFYFISPRTVLPAGAIFLGIDLFAYVVNCIGIGRMKPVELLKGGNTGEKEPKVKWAMLILGILALGAGYGISLTTDNPLKAILVFFLAVLLVIVGTYFLFIAGSVFVLKALKKREAYYYQPGHITAVSGLLYRMKQNGVGLASVAILATGVLVMISSTFCLYSRTESVLEANYPQDYYIPAAFYPEEGDPVEIPEDVIARTVQDCAEKHGLKVRDGFFEKYFDVTYLYRNGELTGDQSSVSTEADLSDLYNFTFITEETYRTLGGEALGLKDDQVALCAYRMGSDFPDDTFLLHGREYTVAKRLARFPLQSAMITVNTYGVVVADDSVFHRIFRQQQEGYQADASWMQYRYCVTFENREKTLEVGTAFSQDVQSAMDSRILEMGYPSYSIGGYDSYWQSRNNLYGMYGTLLFLGILLGAVCLFATVLIIYYKQISEGYEDRNRYQIMRKIGLTDTEVKKTIRSQIMLVFFLPLITAGIHVAFAYPILTKLMSILLLDNVWRFAIWSVIVYAVFAVVYAMIYKLTAKTYYKIVY